MNDDSYYDHINYIEGRCLNDLEDGGYWQGEDDDEDS